MAKTEDLKVFISIRDSTCDECHEQLGRHAWITLAGERGALCLACADLDHLVFLPSGDAALTRRAKKHSGLHAVVLKWSRARKRYERQGLLVKEEALATAEEECLADEDARRRSREREAARRADLDKEYVNRFAERIRELKQFSGLSPDARGAGKTTRPRSPEDRATGGWGDSQANLASEDISFHTAHPRKRLESEETARQPQASIATEVSPHTHQFFQLVARLGHQAATALDHAHESRLLDVVLESGARMRGILATVNGSSACRSFRPKNPCISACIVDRQATIEVLARLRNRRLAGPTAPKP